SVFPRGAEQHSLHSSWVTRIHKSPSSHQEAGHQKCHSTPLTDTHTHTRSLPLTHTHTHTQSLPLTHTLSSYQGILSFCPNLKKALSIVMTHCASTEDAMCMHGL